MVLAPSSPSYYTDRILRSEPTTPSPKNLPALYTMYKATHTAGKNSLLHTPPGQDRLLAAWGKNMNGHPLPTTVTRNYCRLDIGAEWSEAFRTCGDARSPDHSFLRQSPGAPYENTGSAPYFPSFWLGWVIFKIRMRVDLTLTSSCSVGEKPMGKRGESGGVRPPILRTEQKVFHFLRSPEIVRGTMI